MTLVGYARVSTDSQDLAAQLDALAAAGCTRVFSEVVSSTVVTRPQLQAALDYLRSGDVLVVVAVDRLSRRTLEFLTLIEQLSTAGVEFRSLTQDFDTTTPAGRMVMSIFAVFAQNEREDISRRTKAGLASARARGSAFGRPSVLTADRLEAIADAHRRQRDVASIAATLGISPRSVARGLALLRTSGVIE